MRLLVIIVEQNSIGILVVINRSPIKNSLHMTPQGRYLKTWRHPQNRKCTTYRNAARGGPNHGRRQRAR